MAKNEDIEIIGTTADFLVQMLTDEEDGETFAQEYIKAGFLSSAVDALFYARRQAGLTQAEVAEQLHTKQAAIARLEADTAGSMSLHRFVEFALACGMVPLDITLVPVSSLRDYIIEHPEAPRTPDAYNAWLTKSSQPLRQQTEAPKSAASVSSSENCYSLLV